MITCPRLQQQGTGQLTGTKEVCWAKKIRFSLENGSVRRLETEIFFGVAKDDFFCRYLKCRKDTVYSLLTEIALGYRTGR